MTLIAIDAGHGYETPGKRSPDGMREYAFNRAVAKELMIQLEGKSIRTIQTHHDATDVPLIQRTILANQSRAAFLVSIHANAFGNGQWNEVAGIETYVHTKKGNAARPIAQTIHQALITGTKQKDRGIKQADFYLLRESTMPAVLVECGFMTNRQEKALLASPEYRIKCGRLIADGIVSYLKEVNLYTEDVTNPSSLYRVQTGVFSSKKNAENQVSQLKKAGFEAIISNA